MIPKREQRRFWILQVRNKRKNRKKREKTKDKRSKEEGGSKKTKERISGVSRKNQSIN